VVKSVLKPERLLSGQRKKRNTFRMTIERESDRMGKRIICFTSSEVEVF